MRGPARLMAMLAVAAAVQTAAAADRFVPTDPDFVVANVRQFAPDEPLRRLIAQWRAEPAAEGASVALAGAFIERARAQREPMYFGRAEAVLASVAGQRDASAAQRRLYAEVLQYRHDFLAAEVLLDGVLKEAPHDVAARIQRASVRLVRGNFAGARGDCGQLVAGGDAAGIGFACLAEALAGSGDLARGQALLANISNLMPADPAAQAYLLATRAELRERAQDTLGAITDYRQAQRLAPNEDSLRAALADALSANDQAQEARELLDVDKPSLALLVRSAAIAEGAERNELVTRAQAWLDLELARGDAPHYREAALLSLANRNAAAALDAARKNFELQREVADVRVLARAAVAARDDAAQRELRRWFESTGFRDSVAIGILDHASGS